ncbi:hypothetical protein ABIC10_003913 [Bradyrhizobium sp. S3.2.12]
MRQDWTNLFASGWRAHAQAFDEAHEVTVRILDEEFALAEFLIADPIPGFVRLFVERPFGIAESAQHGINAIDDHLEIDAASEWPLHLGRLPAPIQFAEHDLQTPPDEIRKSRIGAIVSELEAEQVAPERQAGLNAGNAEFGNEIGKAALRRAPVLSEVARATGSEGSGLFIAASPDLMADLRGGYRSEAARRPDAEWGERVLAGERLETLADLRWLPIPDLHARARHRLRHRRARHRVDRRQPRRVAAGR